MGWLIFLAVGSLVIFWFTKKSGYCEKCNRSLSHLSVLFGRAKLIDNKVICESCSKEYISSSSDIKNPLTSQKANEIKDAKKVLWLKYSWSEDKIFEEKINIAKVTKESITGFSHSWRKIQRFYYERIIDWKMLDEYVPGKEPFVKMSGMEFYDTYAENAIKLKKRVWIKYEDYNGNVTERKIDIYFSKYGDFHCWDYLRNEPRSFKIDRVREWKILDETFERNPMVEQYLKAKQDRDNKISNLSYSEWIQNKE